MYKLVCPRLDNSIFKGWTINYINLLSKLDLGLKVGANNLDLSLKVSIYKLDLSMKVGQDKLIFGTMYMPDKLVKFILNLSSFLVVF